uniref:Uncharacterized protein n=1 Tax=Rhizophora mucronata TaxID=61149 RepID=A0A2P2JJJ1_RHIMU
MRITQIYKHNKCNSKAQ